MKKTTRFSTRLMALLLCALCLLAATSVAALATDAQPVESAAGESETVTPSETDEADPVVSEAVQPEAETVPSLYDRLMACTSVAEVDEILNNLTEEDEAEMEVFSPEQNAALEAHLAELGYYDADSLENRSYSIAQGETQTVTINQIKKDGFSYSCSESGITAQRTNDGYTISVGSSVPVGTYTLTVNYKVGGKNSTTKTDTITITVTSSGSSGGSETDKVLTVTNTMTHAEVVYVKIENDQIVDSFVPVTSGVAITTTLPSSSYAIAFFVKPESEYLLTQFYRNDGNATDLYSVETPAKDCKFQYFKNNTSVGDEILEQAKDMGYLGYYGFTGKLSSDYSASFVEIGEAPQMTVSAAASPNEDLKPGDKVTFTVTVTPGNLSTGADYSITNKTITSLTINGVSYTDKATKNTDGTYSVEYVITQEDWLNQKATLNVTASLTYDYKVSVTDRGDTTGTIETTKTITSSATTDCTFATKQGVVYQVKFDPADKADPTKFPTTPVDDGEYFQDNTVTVDSSYKTDPVDDPTNGGTWTFTGWKVNGEGEDKNAGDTVTMGTEKILFVGTWTFTPYPNADLTIRKTVSGNMQDPEKAFAFTVTADKAMTYNEEEKTSFTFNLKKGEEVVISVPIGATVTVSEDASGYTYSIGSGTTITGYTNLTSGNGISFTMPSSNSTVVFNNEKNITIDTGVILDTLPYVLILAAVVVGAAVMMKQRRNRSED